MDHAFAIGVVRLDANLDQVVHIRWKLVTPLPIIGVPKALPKGTYIKWMMIAAQRCAGPIDVPVNKLWRRIRTILGEKMEDAAFEYRTWIGSLIEGRSPRYRQRPDTSGVDLNQAMPF